MRAVRIPLFVLLAVLFFILWNAAWVTDRCGEWTAAVDTVTADLDAGGDGGAALGTLDDLWQDVQGYMHIIVSHEDLDEAEALMAQAKALSAQGSTEDLYPVLAQLRHQFRLIAETQQLSPKISSDGHFSLSSLFSSDMNVLISLNCRYTEAKRT